MILQLGELACSGVSVTDSGALYDKPGLELLLVETEACRAVIGLQGAQVLEFQAAGAEPLLWLSPRAEFRAGVSVRGGVPVCLPWFGINREDPEKPKHGFVRNHDWQLASAQQSDGRVMLDFEYDHAGDALFATPFHCALTISLGDSLEFSLKVENTGEAPSEFSWALHTYFSVPDIASVQVGGLDGLSYLDNTDGLARKRQDGLVHFSGEVDRVYENCGPLQQIFCGRTIECRSDLCDSVIVWNPGAVLANTVADIGADGARGFVCVEHGNAFENSWTLTAGEVRRAQLRLKG
ncbi:D-hexose-6-phosphate mutarotase [Biformimicrobium ophioploci]|uniref:Putative glucose-6-phosphate 1-epimerase n=1 Tax=Biformimicrobium ophioploci TaxID=3036711 RepID=A0ABQ6LWI2_9GAMM|nr:D-hexose-6-phosphate mutarotase [Microbulbifer sp. NKW57]GMG86421.1 D-hexose-6-phosphate mutarotase [Microbulbifer sp. NKW57]